MRIDISARQNGEPLERLADGLIFLSGGILQLIDRVGAAADEWGFAGKVRIEVVARGLIDDALAPLASEYESQELDRASALLSDAIDRVGREFFPEQYTDESGGAVH
jgi:hypothetical protein